MSVSYNIKFKYPQDRINFKSLLKDVLTESYKIILIQIFPNKDYCIISDK